MVGFLYAHRTLMDSLSWVYLSNWKLSFDNWRFMMNSYWPGIFFFRRYYLQNESLIFYRIDILWGIPDKIFGQKKILSK
jgi:hypothetical protein